LEKRKQKQKQKKTKKNRKGNDLGVFKLNILECEVILAAK